MDDESVSEEEKEITHEEKESLHGKCGARLIHRITLEYVRRPVIAYCACFLFILLVCAAGAGAGVFYISEPSSFDWTIASTEESERLDALTDAIDRIYYGVDSTSTQRERDNTATTFFVYSRADHSDIFTPENLKSMCEAEAILVNNPQYPEFCRVGKNVNVFLFFPLCILPLQSFVLLSQIPIIIRHHCRFEWGLYSS